MAPFTIENGKHIMFQKLDFLHLCALALVTSVINGCGPSTENPNTTTTTSSSSGEQGGAGGTGGTGGNGGQGGAAGTSVWGKPTCESISGTSAVTFTSDEGATLAPTPGKLNGIGYTFGLAALDIPNTLLAEHQGILLRSEDAGCTWSEFGQLPDGPYRITAAKGGLAYAWTDNNAQLYRIDAKGPKKLQSPLMNIVGLGVDPKDGLHLRIGDASGKLSDSIDGGESWMKQGDFPTTGVGYRFAFDPADLEHVLFGQSSVGAAVSFDGGKTIKPSTGLADGTNPFSLVVSPVDKNIVWAQGKELASGIAHIYRSTDGGASFSVVATASSEVTLVNGTLLVPHATNTNVLYFAFGTYYNDYGTDLYRYDQTTGQVTKTHNDYDEIGAIVPSPADPDLLYLGLTVEEI